MDWESLITSFIGASAGTGVVGAIVKSRFDGFVQERLEKVRSIMLRETTEHQIRFSHLHQKRAEVLATAYQQLLELHSSAAALTSVLETPDMGTKEQRGERLNAAYREVFSYIPLHMIYLPELTAKKTQNFMDLIRENVIKFNIFVAVERGDINYERWTEAWKSISKDGTSLLNEIANDFRNLLDPPQNTK